MKKGMAITILPNNQTPMRTNAAIVAALISSATLLPSGYAQAACPVSVSSGVNVTTHETCTAADSSYQVNDRYLLRAYGIDSTLNVTAQSVQLTQGGSQVASAAIYADEGGVINVPGALNIYFSPTGYYSSSVTAQHDGSAVHLGSSTTIIHHGGAIGGAAIDAEKGKAIITADGPVSVTTDGALGIYIDQGATVALKDIAITVGDNGNSNPNGIFATDSGSTVSYNNGVMNTSGTAIRILNGATVTASATSDLKTSLNGASGILADGSNSSGLFNGPTTITTYGNTSYGILASNKASVDLLSGGSINTAGVNSSALYAQAGGVISASGVNTTTNGNLSVGALSDGSGSKISYDSGVITTTGQHAQTLLASNGGVIYVNNSNVRSIGQGSAGIKILDDGSLGSTVNLFNTKVRSEGVDAWAADVNGTLNMQGGSLSSALYGAMLASGDATINLNSGAQVISANEVLLSIADENSKISLTLDGGAYAQGDIIFSNTADTNADGVLDSKTKVALLNGSGWKGSTNAIDSLSLDQTSQWVITRSSRLNSLNNSGSIYFAGALGSTVKIADTYTSNSGLLLLNTQLGDDSSLTDKLIAGKVILGSGATRLLVNNINGLGALTTGDGIEVVHVNDSSASSAGAFALGGRVAAGAYEYTLHQNGLTNTNGNWYLRSTLPTVNPPIRPDYRPEVPLNMALPALTNRFALAMLGTYHDRRSESPASTRETDVKQVTWGRVLAEKGSVGESNYNNFLAQGASYDYNIKGFQVGQDIYGMKNANGTTDVAGIYVGRGDISGNVDAVTGGRAGSASMDGTSLGAYWTRKGESGWYIDSVLQGTIYSNVKTNSSEGEKLRTKGSGITASLESGYPIALENNWTVEPQAQLIYQQISLDRAQDTFGKFKFDDTKIGYARLGSRLTKKLDVISDQPATLWARANIWQQIGPDSRTTISSLQGGNPVSLDTRLGGTWAQVGVGVTGKITESISAFTGADYNQAINSGNGHSISGRIGLEVAW